MSLLNYLFADPKKRAKHFSVEVDKRDTIFEEYLILFRRRYKLSWNFGYKYIGSAILHIPDTIQALKNVRDTIPEEFVHIRDEEKTEQELFDDLRAFVRWTKGGEIRGLHDDLRKAVHEEYGRKKALHALFSKIHELLKVELHTIDYLLTNIDSFRNDIVEAKRCGVTDAGFQNLGNKDPRENFLKQLENYKPLANNILKFVQVMLDLFELINFKEETCVSLFLDRTGAEKNPQTEKIKHLALEFLLEREIKDIGSKKDVTFRKDLQNAMSPVTKKHKYKHLGEAILDEVLAQMRKDFDQDVLLFEEHRDKLDEYLENKELLSRIVLQLCPEMTDTERNIVIRVFQEDFEYDEFISDEFK